MDPLMVLVNSHHLVCVRECFGGMNPFSSQEGNLFGLLCCLHTALIISLVSFTSLLSFCFNISLSLD
jgi:hypothetical protein